VSVGLDCLSPQVAGPGSCHGSIQRWYGRTLPEPTHDMRHERACTWDCEFLISTDIMSGVQLQSRACASRLRKSVV
jgi:hypothetical protein